jgi:uracil phosphoribosyltransferase
MFRNALRRVSQLLAYEASAHLPLRDIIVETPLERTIAKELAVPVILVPILRAGLGMVDAILEILPDARVGHIGLYRNEETLEPVEYYEKFPDELEHAAVFVLDPMLATGGSAVAAIKLLMKHGANDIRLISLVSAPEGVAFVEGELKQMHIHTAALDRCLNDRGYIMPGLGDAGDRIFGTGSGSA